MVKQDLMSRITKVYRPNRNRFDISCGRKFTSTVGFLQPVYLRELCPNNHISLSLSNLTRALPMKKANFARMNENFDVFFVPMRLLQTGIQEMLSGIPVNRLASSFIPQQVATLQDRMIDVYRNYIKTNSLKDDCGIDLGIGVSRLLLALGCGTISLADTSGKVTSSADEVFSYQPTSNSYQNVFINSQASVGSTTYGLNDIAFNFLPFLAYQKIYQDYYRNKFWERENTDSYLFTKDASTSWNVQLDDLKKGMLQPRYSNFDRDRIFGMYPDEGNIFSQGINFVNVSSKTNTQDSLHTTTTPDSSSFVTLSALGQQLSHSNSGSDKVNYAQAIEKIVSTNLDESNPVKQGIVQQLNALSMRRMEAWQRFAEITALNKDDYKHQMSALFGADIPDLNSDYCLYLGGKTQPIQITDVEQTTPGSSSTNALGELGGRGTSYGNGAKIDFTAKEHGYLMVIYHIQPQVDYVANFIDPQLRRYDRYDFMNPVFDNLGFEPVRFCDLCNPLDFTSSTNQYFNPMRTLGWLPRYFAYKTDVDTCNQAFIQSSVNGWNTYVLSFNFKDYLTRTGRGPTSSGSLIDYRFFKVYPSIVNNLFYVNTTLDPSTDPFVTSLQVNAIVDLPLSVDGLPY